MIEINKQSGQRSQILIIEFVPQLASIRQMTRQVSRGSSGEYQADERAGVAGLSWRVSG